MLLTYVDESFTDEWYTMVALMVDGPVAAALTVELDWVASAAASAYQLPGGAEVELHGHEIFHAAKAWQGVPPRARIGIFDDVVEAVAPQPVLIIARAMDLVGQRARYPAPEPAHCVVLQHLLERVDECAASLEDYALVIADEVDGQARHRATSPTTGGPVLVDTAAGGSPASSTHCISLRAMRVAWFRQPTSLLFFTGGCSPTRETDHRARKAKTAMWKRLEPRVEHALCWFPTPDGRQSQWGRDVP